MNDTLDLIEAAALLKICKASMQQKANVGDVPGAKIGRSWVFIKKDLLSWLKNEANRQQKIRYNSNTKKEKTIVVKKPKNRRNTIPNLDRYDHLFNNHHN